MRRGATSSTGQQADQRRHEQRPYQRGVDEDADAERRTQHLDVGAGEDASAAKEKNRIRAADVTSRPVRPRPVTTACAVEPVVSYSSRMRARMNTS